MDSQAAVDVQFTDATKNDIYNFLREHGATLEFMHPGIFREYSENGSWEYASNVFGRFLSEKDNALMVDLAFLGIAEEILTALPSNIVNDPIKTRAAPQIAWAIRDCSAHLQHLTHPDHKPQPTL